MGTLYIINKVCPSYIKQFRLNKDEKTNNYYCCSLSKPIGSHGTSEAMLRIFR